MDVNHAPVKSRQQVTPTGEQTHFPIVTVTVLNLTSIFTGLQFLYPEVLNTLRRNPEALAAGEWWRLVTPLVVHADGWLQFIFNSMGLLLIGPITERLFGSRRWLILYLSGGLIGNIVGYRWEPYGAGASVGLSGLIGSLLMWLLWRNEHLWLAVPLYILYFIASLIGLAVSGSIAAVGLGTLFDALFVFLLQRNKARARRFVTISGLLGAFILTALRDNHGPPIIAGACVAVIVAREILKAV